MVEGGGGRMRWLLVGLVAVAPGAALWVSVGPGAPAVPSEGGGADAMEGAAQGGDGVIEGRSRPCGGGCVGGGLVEVGDVRRARRVGRGRRCDPRAVAAPGGDEPRPARGSR